MIQGLVGGVLGGGTSLALFDALSFPMVPGLLFLLIGLIGAARRNVDMSLITRLSTSVSHGADGDSSHRELPVPAERMSNR
jgi:hypothetical protein